MCVVVVVVVRKISIGARPTNTQNEKVLSRVSP
jgi:hypothetical protein